MQKLLINGGHRLEGEVEISGAKNAALPLLCAALLTDAPVDLVNVPDLDDVETMLRLLRHLGASVFHDPEVGLRLQVNSEAVSEAPYDLVKSMRASIMVLGPLVAKRGYARVSLPGGCAIGSRPVDQHLAGLEAMGAQITVEHGYIVARAGRLHGAAIRTEMVTVTGTENLMMAATLADGETTIENAAMEPEVSDLAELLISMGADISGHGTPTIRVRGVRDLVRPPKPHPVIPDRIEAGTFMCAVAACGGNVRLKRVRPDHLGAVIEKLLETGAVEIDHFDGEDELYIRAHRRPNAVSVSTAEYPGFPTDMQAQLMALNCVANGEAVLDENIFENRFMHVNELLRLGADIRVFGRRAIVAGVPSLRGADVMATDLRASASLVIAALAASGQTTLHRIHHLDRGYSRMEEKLRALGADVQRVPA